MKNYLHVVFIFISILIIIKICFEINQFKINTKSTNTNNVTNSTIKKRDYFTAIKQGGEWFLNNQNRDFLYYEYDYINKQHTKNKHHLREMGALWSIAKLSNFLNDQRYNQLAQKGFLYFETHFKKNEKMNFNYVEFDQKDAKLGYSAFIILTLLEIDHPKKKEYLDLFANGIISLQQESGELKTFFNSDKYLGGKDYYPGEALLALSQLYLNTHEKKYLQVIEKAYPFYANYFRNNPNTAFVPWQTQAYAVLYKIKKDKNIAEFIFEMNDYILNNFSTQNTCSDFDIDEGSTIAIYVEGVNKAYEIAKSINDKQRALCYKTFIQEASKVIINAQIKDNSDNLSKGGFQPSGSSHIMRVDRNQHAIMSLIGSYEVL